MMKKDSIGIIGCGNMGAAIAKGIEQRRVFPAEKVCLYDVDAGKAARLSEEAGGRSCGLAETMKVSGVLLVAVKPSDFNHLSKDMAAYMDEQAIVSVMAGVKIREIVSRLGKEAPVVRAMPNLAAAFGHAVTCLSFNEKAENSESAEKIREVFSSVGGVVDVDEEKMDIVTAVSGSGPAYLFALAEAMAEAAAENGLSADVSGKIVSGTLLGASMLLEKSPLSPGELIRKVASRGGTTEAALRVFDEKGFKTVVKEAVFKARERSSEISEGGATCS
jgi:pyrroline-5-carboxylate reductase